MMETVTSAKRLKIAHENQLKLNSENTTNASNRRTLHVEGVGMAKSVPDVCHLLISIVSQKMSVTQAKNSVDRRVAYIKQTILNCHIQESEMKTFQSIQSGYTHCIEIYITTNDASKLYDLSEILTQKLDETVSLSPITFSISPTSQAHSRSQSASNAVQNARRKASEMARLVEGSLGSPLSIEQLCCEELAMPSITDGEAISQFTSWQQTCITMKSTVRILFELKPRK